MLIQPLVTNYPLNDRDFDYNHQELTALQLIAKLIATVNKTVEAINSFQGSINKKEDSLNITLNRKLSDKGDFTGSIQGIASALLISNIFDNSDKISYLANQFSDGYTGLVIDGGFFENTMIAKNYDGGVF